MEQTKLTGYPSIDKPWLKYYKEDAEERANDIPQGKTVWDIIEEKLIEYKHIPAIEYFGRTISRPEFIDMVYTWAKVFRAIGVKENEIVAYYGPFFPDVGAMAFALNLIGACPYFLKLAISLEALAEETKECKIAIVFEDMWQNVSGEFTKDRFDRIIIINAFDGMMGVKKHVVSLLSKLKSKNVKLPTGKKYLSLKEAKSIAHSYSGIIKASFVPNRPAFITSSSGTTVDGVVKETVATNESAISQLYMGENSELQYIAEKRCLNHFPPTASTSLNSLFFLPLYMGMTVVMDPRVSENDFYNQVCNLRCSFIVNTGSAWEAFFTRVEREMAKGKRFQFNDANSWLVGGEGTDVKKFGKWRELMLANKAKRGVLSGYGLSELFAGICTEPCYVDFDSDKQIMEVGIPHAGMVVGVFDEKGSDVGYNKRGELWVISKSAMKEYYNKPELTAKTKVDGWIHTGDLAEINENGFVYIWGRLTDKVEFADGKSVYLFDIANEIKKKEYIDDAIVLSIATEQNKHTFVAHIVWLDEPTKEEKRNRIIELTAMIRDFSQGEYEIAGYYEYKNMLPYSPTTLKKDTNKMSKQRSGYLQVADGNLQTVDFE